MGIINIYIWQCMGKYGPWYWITSYLLCRDWSVAARCCACLLAILWPILLNTRQNSVYSPQLHAETVSWPFDKNSPHHWSVHHVSNIKQNWPMSAKHNKRLHVNICICIEIARYIKIHHQHQFEWNGWFSSDTGILQKVE